jgi:non-ribosomal peptide synthetase component F/aryl carrier-like protein
MMGLAEAEPLGWARSPLPGQEKTGGRTGGALWLVFADGMGLGAAIVRRLATEGTEGTAAATVLPGAAFARTGEGVWTLTPGRREDCVALLADLGARPSFVLHLWALAPAGPQDLFARLERAEEAGFRSLLPLLWSLSGPGASRSGPTTRVIVAAAGMQRVLRGEAADPARSSLPGLCATVTASGPSLLCRTVDLLPSEAGARRKRWIDTTAGLLLAEARHGKEPAVAYRQGERWEPVPGEAPETGLERTLAEIWRQLLGGPPVRRREGFFERGGDSRTALRLAERLRETLGVELPLADLLAAPTLAGLAEAIERRQREGEPPVRPLPPAPSPVRPPALPPRTGEGELLQSAVSPQVASSFGAVAPLSRSGREGGGRAGEGTGEGADRGRPPCLLDPAAWRRLKERAARRAVTPAGLLLAAFCDVLATWSDPPRFAVAVAGGGLVAIDAAAPGSFSDRASTVQESLWATRAGSAPADWPVTFSFSFSGGSAPLPGGGSADGRGDGGEGLLHCHAAESDGTLTLHWVTGPDRLAPGIADAMLGALRDHLHRLAAPGGEAAWSDERRRLIPTGQLARRVHAGGPGAPFPRERLEALVAAQAEATPGRTAVQAPGHTLSYGELLTHARRLGHHLRSLGAGPGLPVAVVLEPGWEAAVAILGVLAAGAAWVPVDPSLPPRLLRERLTDHLAAAPGRPALAVTSRRTGDRLAWPEGPPEIHRVLLDELPADGGGPFRTSPSAADLACIIPLPGSGGPMIEHRGLANAVLDINRTFGIGPGDRFLASSPPDRLQALYELFGPLTAGGTLVVSDAAAGNGPEDWLNIVRREGITVWIAEPEPLSHLLEAAGRTGGGLPFRLVLVSGRIVLPDLADRLRAACPEARLARLTPVPEAPLWAASAPLDAPPAFYGRPLANLTLHVLDDRLEPRPNGVSGSLHLGGPGLARGTWRAPLAAAARFTVHPDTGERLFRTGETARVRGDGGVEIVEEGRL